MPHSSAPSDGERNAVIGLRGQYLLAARIVLAQVPRIVWIRVADPSAGVGDDFQFKSGDTHHAIQVKWSEFGTSFTWSDLTVAKKGKKPLIAGMAEAWAKIKGATADSVVVHLCSNEMPSDTKPVKSSDLANASHGAKNHFAGFLARSLEPLAQEIRVGTISTVGELEESTEFVGWAPWWVAFLRAAGLKVEQLLVFLPALRFDFGLAPWLSDSGLIPTMPTETDLNRLAGEFQAIVADPRAKVEFSREELFNRLGWQGRVSFRNRHDFPIPEAYVRNAAASDGLIAALDRVDGGYIALVAPAGAGKSSTLADLRLADWLTAKYYAFLPNAVDPLTARGEADVFLRDLSLLLEESGIWRSGFGVELTDMRQILTTQLERCGQRYQQDGARAMIIVDGLDHVPREQSPTRSLLLELPNPNAIPEGVYVILGTQTTEILPLPLRRALDEPGRVIEVPPLTDEEVEQIAIEAGPGKWMGTATKGELVKATAGNPLPLSYLLEELRQLEDNENRLDAARVIIQEADLLGGDLEARYDGYYETVTSSTALIDILGIVCRMRVAVDINWLATWADPAALSAFVERASVYFRREGHIWTIIHNSFRLYLARRTSQRAGFAPHVVDAELHRRLADLYASSTDLWPQYLDEEIAHRLLGGQLELVIQLGAPDVLLKKLERLRPPSIIRTHARHALEAAASLGDMPALVRQVLFLNDMEQRSMVLDESDFAEHLVAIDPLLFGLDHVLEGSTLRVKVSVAANLALGLANLGHSVGATRVLKAIGGLGAFTKDGARTQEEWYETRRAVDFWVRATAITRGVPEVIAEVDQGLVRAISTLDEKYRAAEAELIASAPDLDDGAVEDEAEPRWRRERRLDDMWQDVAIARSVLSMALVAGHRHCQQLHGSADAEAFLHRLQADGSTRSIILAKLNTAEIAHRDGLSVLYRDAIREAVELAISRGRNLDVGGDSEQEEDDSDEGVSLGLRIRIAEHLLMSPYGDSEVVERLLPIGEVVAWPSFGASGSGLNPWREWFMNRRVKALLGRDPGPAPTGKHSEVARTRLHRALDALARLEASERLVSAGIGHSIEWADTDHIWRVLELPQPNGRHETGWYQVVDAAPEILKRFMMVVSRTNVLRDSQALLRRISDAWDDPERADYWGPRMRLAVIDGALRGACADWGRAQLEACEEFIESTGADPESLKGWWLKISTLWLVLDDKELATRAASKAFQVSLGPGVSEHDRQLVGWISWLRMAIETIKNPTIGAEMVRRYAGRLEMAATADKSIAEDAVEELLGVAWGLNPGLAVDMADRLVDAGIVGEWSALRQLLESAFGDVKCSAVILSAAVREIIVPTAVRPAGNLFAAMVSRVDDGEVDRLKLAVNTWLQPSDAESWESELHSLNSPNPQASAGPVFGAGALLARI